MPSKSKTHFEEVPLEVAQKLAKEQVPTQPIHSIAAKRHGKPIRRRSGKNLTQTKIAAEREDV